MTAYRVIDDHNELENIGQLSHAQLDTYITGSTFLVVSGSGPLPPAARRLVAGPGIIINDEGPGGRLIISASAFSPGSSFSWMEVPSEQADGANTTFTFVNTPAPTTSLMFFVNGVLQFQGPTSDYTLTGSVVTTNYAPRASSNIVATYPY